MTNDTGWDLRVAILALLPLGMLVWAPSVPHLASAALYLNLWALTLFDIRSFRLPNLLTAVLFVTGFAHAYVAPRFGFGDHIIGALVGLLLFPVINAVYKRLRGRDGIGLGDAKLLAGIGAWLGWPALPFVLLAASISGLLFGIYGVATKRVKITETRIPFGPFLCFGCWLVWLFF